MASILMANVFRVRNFPGWLNVLRLAVLYSGCGCASKPCSIPEVGRRDPSSRIDVHSVQISER